jgi:hypothetical protein
MSLDSHRPRSQKGRSPVFVLALGYGDGCRVTTLSTDSTMVTSYPGGPCRCQFRSQTGLRQCL